MLVLKECMLATRICMNQGAASKCEDGEVGCKCAALASACVSDRRGPRR